MCQEGSREDKVVPNGEHQGDFQKHQGDFLDKAMNKDETYEQMKKGAWEDMVSRNLQARGDEISKEPRQERD